MAVVGVYVRSATHESLTRDDGSPPLALDDFPLLPFPDLLPSSVLPDFPS